jgi:hypothetical protein
MPAIMASAMIQVATTSFWTFPMKMEDTSTECFLQVWCPCSYNDKQKEMFLAIFTLHWWICSCPLQLSWCTHYSYLRYEDSIILTWHFMFILCILENQFKTVNQENAQYSISNIYYYMRIQRVPTCFSSQGPSSGN